MPSETQQQRQNVIDKLDKADLSKIGQHPKPDDDELPPDETAEQPDAEDEPTEPDEPAETDEPAEDQDAADDAVADLRDEIAELREQLEKTTTPGGTGEPPAGSPAQSAKIFSKVREKIAKAKAEWGELVDAIGLEDMLAELEPLVGAIDTLKTSQATQARATQQAAMNAVHTDLDGIASGNAEIAKFIGTSKRNLTRGQEKNRQLIVEEAFAEQQRHQRLINAGRRRTMLSDEDFIAKAVEIVTGRKIDKAAAERRVAERARQVTPGKNASSTTQETSPEAGRRRAEANVENFLRSRGG